MTSQLVILLFSELFFLKLTLCVPIKEQFDFGPYCLQYTGWVVTWFLLGYTVRMFEYTVRTF